MPYRHSARKQKEYRLCIKTPGGYFAFLLKRRSTVPDSLFQVAMLLLATVFLLATGSSIGHAQGKKTENEVLAPYEICLPDCYNDKWIEHPEPITITIGTCKFKVEFAYRKACEQYCDIAIKSIKNYSGITTNTHCTTMSISLVYDIAAVNVLRYALQNIPRLDCGPTGLGQCSTYWRVASSSCWQYQPLYFDGPDPDSDPDYPPWADNPTAAQGEAAFYSGAFTTCTLNACCFSTYSVCIDGTGNIIVTRTSQIQTAPCPPDMPRCTPSCGG